MVDDAARARRQTRAPSTKRASDGRGCQPSAGTRPRRRLWTWRRHALARRAWLAGHGGRLLCSGTSSRAVDGPKLLGPMSQSASTGSRAISRPGRRSRGITISLFACTSTWPAPWKTWWGGWRTASLREGPCSWSDTARSIPAPELPRLRQVRCKSQSRVRSLCSIPMCGSWSSQRSVRAPSPALVSMQ